MSARARLSVEDARTLLGAFADGELDLERAREVEDALERSAELRAELEALEQSGVALRAWAAVEIGRAPASMATLTDRVRAQIAREEGAPAAAHARAAAADEALDPDERETVAVRVKKPAAAGVGLGERVAEWLRGVLGPYGPSMAAGFAAATLTLGVAGPTMWYAMRGAGGAGAGGPGAGFVPVQLTAGGAMQPLAVRLDDNAAAVRFVEYGGPYGATTQMAAGGGMLMIFVKEGAGPAGIEGVAPAAAGAGTRGGGPEGSGAAPGGGAGPEAAPGAAPAAPEPTPTKPTMPPDGGPAKGEPI